LQKTPVLPGQSGFVLLIDDDHDSLEIFRQTLEWAGLEVKTARTGREGLHLANSDPPAVAFVDLTMPERTGVDVLRALRADPRTHTVAAVALTGVPELLDEVSDVKFDWVLTKPVPPDQLIRVAKSLIATAHIDPTA
jgi:two-component system phosphate regulon response regulator PhoB